MKVICHIDDDIEDEDLIFVSEAIKSIRSKKPEGVGGLYYPFSKIAVSYIKNKSSYSIWVRYDEH